MGLIRALWSLMEPYGARRPLSAIQGQQQLGQGGLGGAPNQNFGGGMPAFSMGGAGLKIRYRALFSNSAAGTCQGSLGFQKGTIEIPGPGSPKRDPLGPGRIRNEPN